MSALLNGAPVAGTLALHRGLHYGDGVFRTCLIHEGRVVDLPEQCRKVMADAERLGMAAVDGEALRGEAAALARAQARGVLKILLLPRTQLPTACCACTRRRRCRPARGTKACACSAPRSGWRRNRRWPGSST
jgi:branched-subunit amino acid aminotransferase/4-amino-4-deoxychorismate lyase